MVRPLFLLYLFSRYPVPSTYVPCLRTSSIGWESRLIRNGIEIRRIVVGAAPDNFAAHMAAGRCGHASAVDHVHTRAATFAGLRDHVVRLMKRRRCHGLRGCCDGHGKDNSDQPE